MAQRKSRLLIKKHYDYARDYSVSVGGEAVYIGPLYEFYGDIGDLRRKFRAWVVLTAAMTALLAVCGFLRVAAMRLAPVVALGYALDLVVSILLLVSCIRLVRAEYPMERRTFDTSFGRLRPFSLVSAVLGAAAFVADVVFMLTHRQLGVTVPEGVFTAALAAVTALAAVLFASCVRIRHRSREQTEQKP